MKALYIIVIGSFFCITAYSQNRSIQIDSTVIKLKSYFKKNIKFPPVALKDYVQGTMILCFKVNRDQKIGEIRFVRHLTGECDSTVAKVLKNYSQTLSLLSNEYTIGLRFLILENGKPDSEVTPLDKRLYKNFLFEINVTAEFPKRKPSIVN
jgi:hypothetical protein